MPDAATLKFILAFNQLYNILLLENDGFNFQVWKYYILTVLDVQELVSFVNETEVKPIIPDGPRQKMLLFYVRRSLIGNATTRKHKLRLH